MGLVRIFDPRTASEALVVMAMLEAHEIPAYLRSGHLGSILPGVQVGGYNSQSVLVPEEHAEDALQMLSNFRAAPAPVGHSSILRNFIELLLGGWYVPARHRPMHGNRQLASFVAFHEGAGTEQLEAVKPTFAVVLARANDGVVLVFNQYRKVWELPGGLIDPGETPQAAVARELTEEAGCHAKDLRCLGLVEVDDSATHFGAVYDCRVDDVPSSIQNEEIGGIGRWRRGESPRPLGESDAALLNLFG